MLAKKKPKKQNPKNHDDKSCRCLFSGESRQLSSASYTRPGWFPVFSSVPSSLVGDAGVCTVPKHLNEKDAIVGLSLL